MKWVYVIVGLSLLNETLTLNFPLGASSTSATVPGGDLGLGVAFKPALLQQWGRPVLLFAEWNWMGWADAKFNAPPTSPAFNYKFNRSDNVIRAGFMVQLGK